MLDNCTDVRERWNAVESLLQGWLKVRREVLINYTGVASTFEQDSDNSQQNLQGLCQVLVDYVSAGHFEVFHELIPHVESFHSAQRGIDIDSTFRPPPEYVQESFHVF